MVKGQCSGTSDPRLPHGVDQQGSGGGGWATSLLPLPCDPLPGKTAEATVYAPHSRGLRGWWRSLAAAVSHGNSSALEAEKGGLRLAVHPRRLRGSRLAPGAPHHQPRFLPCSLPPGHPKMT